MSASQMKFQQKQDGRISAGKKQEEDGGFKASEKGDVKNKKHEQRKDLIRETV